MKNVLITGASGGIGLAIAKELIKENYRLILHVHSDEKEITKAFDGIDSDKYTIIKGAFDSEERVNSFIEKLNSFCSIDILISAAGTYSKFQDFMNIDMTEFKRLLQVNLYSHIMLSQHVIENMKNNKWGRIVNLGSSNVKHGGSSSSLHYTLSKAGLEVLSNSLAKDYSQYNVLVNTVRIGFTDTKFHSMNSNKDLDKRLSYIPLRRQAKPIEMAKFIKFLVSDENTYITGAVLDATGGE